MSGDRQPVLVCTAWPYANGSLHVGHLAGVYVPADVFARYQRLRGNDVLMVSGTDEHGTPDHRARRAGGHRRRSRGRRRATTRSSSTYWRDLGISYDLYTTTTTDNHREVVQDEFLMLLDKGYLYRATIGRLLRHDGRSLPARHATSRATCPHCQLRHARAATSARTAAACSSPSDLIRPVLAAQSERDASSAAKPSTSTWTCPSSRRSCWSGRATSTHWRPNVYRFTLNFLEGGLQPRAITRDLELGRPAAAEIAGLRRQAHLRLVRGVQRLPHRPRIEWAERRGEPDAWERWWKDPRAVSTTSSARTTSPSTR